MSSRLDETRLCTSINTDTLPQFYTTWTAELVSQPSIRWNSSNTFHAQYSSIRVTIMPTIENENKSYEQVPKAKFCGPQQVYITKGQTQTISNQEELERIPLEERLNFKLVVKEQTADLTCALICSEEYGRCYNYLLVYPSMLNHDILIDIVNRPYLNVEGKMKFLSTMAFIQNHIKSLTHLYNYCENVRPINSTSTIVNDIALHTALQLAHTAGVSPIMLLVQDYNNQSPVQTLAHQLNDVIAPQIPTKTLLKTSSCASLKRIFQSGDTSASFYKGIESAVFAPLAEKQLDTNLIHFSAFQLIKSFVWFFVLFPILTIWHLISSCRSSSGRCYDRIMILVGIAFISALYFSLISIIVVLVAFYNDMLSDNPEIIIQLWIPFIFWLHAIVFCYCVFGTFVLQSKTLPRFTSIKQAYNSAKLIVLHKTRSVRGMINSSTNSSHHSHDDNDNIWSQSDSMSLITKEYRKVPKWIQQCIFGLILLLALTAFLTERILLRSLASEQGNASSYDNFTNETHTGIPWLSVFIKGYLFSRYFILVITFPAAMLSCMKFYLNGYYTIKRILEAVIKIQYCDSERSERSKLDVRKAESLEYLFSLIHVVIDALSYSFAHLIMISSNVVVLFILTIVGFINYIQIHSPSTFTILNCAVLTVYLAVPSVIIIFFIASVNTMVTRNLRKLLEDNREQLTKQILNKQTSENHDNINEIITARDYLHEKIRILTNQSEFNMIKLLRLMPVDRKLLISVAASAVSSVITWLLAWTRNNS